MTQAHKFTVSRETEEKKNYHPALFPWIFGRTSDHTGNSGPVHLFDNFINIFGLLENLIIVC